MLYRKIINYLVSIKDVLLHYKKISLVFLGLLALIILPASLLIYNNFSIHSQVKTKELTVKPKNIGNGNNEIVHFRNITYQIKTGDNLIDIFESYNVNEFAYLPFVNKLSEIHDIETIKQGDELSLEFSRDDNILKNVILKIDSNKNIVVNKILASDLSEDGKKAYQYIHYVNNNLSTKQFVKVTGVIESSLFQAARKSNIPNKITHKLIDIYSYAIDFQRDLRKGDDFEILYSKVINADGVDIGKYDILYASLDVANKPIAVYKYDNNEVDENKSKDKLAVYNYFTADGRTINNSLLRTPVPGARLSSNFGMRKHPILGYSKMHKGLDFAAPAGTPIFAAGNGRVVEARYKGTYGKYIRVRHDDDYSTAYAHLSKFAKNMRKGSKVTQGQVIGYVGTTGRSTGNHLHYEVLYKNVHVNPRTVKLPAKKILKDRELSKFFAYINGVYELSSNMDVNNDKVFVAKLSD